MAAPRKRTQPLSHPMKHLSLAILLHGAVLLPFAVTAAMLVAFGQYVAAAVFSLFPALLVAGIWWIASWSWYSADTGAAARGESSHR